MKVTFQTTIKRKLQTFTCESPFFAVRKYDHWHKHLAILEINGAPTAIQAIWAHLVKRRTGQDSENTDIKIKAANEEITLAVIPGSKYYKTVVGNTLVLSIAEFGKKSRKCFLGGDYENPSPYFIDAFRINVPQIPVLRTWAYDLWKLGLDKGGIKPLFNYGPVNAWEIVSHPWEDVIKEMVPKWRDSLL